MVCRVGADAKISEIAGAYAAWLTAHGRKESTARLVVRCLRACARLGGDVPVGEIGEEYIYRIAWSRGPCARSRREYLLKLGEAVEWAVGTNPYKEAGVLWSLGEPDRVWIDADQWRSMMDVSDERTRLILCLGACMGLRRTEMAGLTLGDVCGGVLTVRGKGHGPDGKTVRMAIPSQVAEAMRAWMAVRQAEPGVEAVLTTARGKALGSGSVGDLVREAGQRAGVRATTHSLRRLYAMTLYYGGADVKTVQAMLRHESPRTTLECYINPDPSRIREAVGIIERSMGCLAGGPAQAERYSDDHIADARRWGSRDIMISPREK